MKENTNSNWFEDKKLPTINNQDDLEQAFSIIKNKFNGSPKFYTRTDFILLINTLYAALKRLDAFNADNETIEWDSTTNILKVKDNVFDKYNSAAIAEQEAKNYADSLASNYDASGEAERLSGIAEENAKKYADNTFQKVLDDGDTYNPHLVWNDTDKKWTPGIINIPTFEEMLPDGATENQILSWDGTSLKWVNVAGAAPELPDYTSENANQVLQVEVLPAKPGEANKVQLKWADGITYEATDYDEDDNVTIVTLSNNEIDASCYTTNAIDKMFKNTGNGSVEDIQQQINELYWYIEEIKAGGHNILGRVSFEDSAINGSIADEKLFGENVYLIEQEPYIQSSFVQYEFNEQLKGGVPYVLSFYSKADRGFMKALILSLDGEPLYNQNIALSIDEWGQSYAQVWFDLDIDGFILKLAFVEASNIYISCLKLQAGDIPTAGFEATSDDIDNLQKQIDGKKNSWFLEGEPTLTNAPANEWTTDELKQRHEGDTYTDITTFVDNTTTPTAGQSWRWCNTDDEYGTGWHWHKIADNDAVKALVEAEMAKTAANYAQQTADTARVRAGSTNTNSKIYLIGAEKQQSYDTTSSHDTCYVDTDGFLYNGTATQDISANKRHRVITGVVAPYSKIQEDKYILNPLQVNNMPLYNNISVYGETRHTINYIQAGDKDDVGGTSINLSTPYTIVQLHEFYGKQLNINIPLVAVGFSDPLDSNLDPYTTTQIDFCQPSRKLIVYPDSGSEFDFVFQSYNYSPNYKWYTIYRHGELETWNDDGVFPSIRGDMTEKIEIDIIQDSENMYYDIIMYIYLK